MIKIVKINSRLTMEERETHLHYDPISKIWLMDTMILKHYNKAKKQGWRQFIEYVYDDGSVCGGVFEAPGYSVTIRSVEKKKLSDKQMTALNGDAD